MAQFGVKGSHVAQAKLVIDEKLGPGAFARLARAFSEDSGWEDPTVNDWYDALVLQNVAREVTRETGGTLVALATEIARRNALHDLNGMYRMFLRVAQPVRMLHFTPQLWRNYVQFGSARAPQNVTGSYELQIESVPEALLDWVKGCCLGFIPTGIELAGGSIQSARISGAVANGESSSVTLAVKYGMK